MQDRNALLRTLPQVEEILGDQSLQQALEEFPLDMVVEAVRAAIDETRQGILAGTVSAVDAAAITATARMRTLSLRERSLRRVVNASGVIVHTNLGRSPLAQEAIDAVSDVIAGYSTLEYSTKTLSRGSRHDHCEQLICALTGAEAAIAVNNNAAAVMMVLNEFAAGHEAVVSRGEEVEIGGSFRIPDIMAQSHASMVEVGATNKTHVGDYEQAVSPDTAMLLKVHRSNFRLIGFTEEVTVADLRKIADNANANRAADELQVLVYEDQGSGAFLKLECFGDYAEPAVAESLHAGADIVSFSGDKLLGGPQAGIIAGRKELIDRLKRNPLARALRLDKMTLAALEATLRLYLDPQQALQKIPTLRMLSMSADEVKPRAEALLEKLQAALPEDAVELSLVPEISRAGGGALPMCDIPTYAVQVVFKKGNALDCERHMVSGREVPVVGRIAKETLLLDARTLLSDEEHLEAVLALAEYFNGLEG